MKDIEKERESVKIKNRLSDILQQPSVIPVMHGNMRQDIGGEQNAKSRAYIAAVEQGFGDLSHQWDSLCLVRGPVGMSIGNKEPVL